MWVDMNALTVGIHYFSFAINIPTGKKQYLTSICCIFSLVLQFRLFLHTGSGYSISEDVHSQNKGLKNLVKANIHNAKQLSEYKLNIRKGPVQYTFGHVFHSKRPFSLNSMWVFSFFAFRQIIKAPVKALACCFVHETSKYPPIIDTFRLAAIMISLCKNEHFIS